MKIKLAQRINKERFNGDPESQEMLKNMFAYALGQTVSKAEGFQDLIVVEATTPTHQTHIVNLTVISEKDYQEICATLEEMRRQANECCGVQGCNTEQQGLIDKIRGICWKLTL